VVGSRFKKVKGGVKGYNLSGGSFGIGKLQLAGDKRRTEKGKTQWFIRMGTGKLVGNYM